MSEFSVNTEEGGKVRLAEHECTHPCRDASSDELAEKTCSEDVGPLASRQPIRFVFTIRAPTHVLTTVLALQGMDILSATAKTRIWMQRPNEDSGQFEGANKFRIWNVPEWLEIDVTACDGVCALVAIQLSTFPRVIVRQ